MSYFETTEWEYGLARHTDMSSISTPPETRTGLTELWIVILFEAIYYEHVLAGISAYPL